MNWTTAMTSVTFRSKSIYEIVQLCVANNIGAIEWGGDIHVPVGDLQAATNTKELCAQNDIEILSYGSYYRGLDAGYTAVIDTAKALGAPIVRVWSGNSSPEACSEEQFQLLVQNFKEMSQYAATHSISIAFEYHRGTLTETKESAYRLLNAINCENVSCYWQPNPDISHEEHLAEISLLAPFIVSFHVFAWTKGNERHLLSSAASQWCDYLTAITQKGITPSLTLEFVKDDDILSFQADSKTLLELCAQISEASSKPLAVFLCNQENIDFVYDAATIKKLEETFLLSKNPIHYESMRLHAALLQKATYIFSTWGMPVLTEDEIATFLPKLKAVFYGAGSVQRFARPFLHRGIKIFSAWTANAVPVSEYCVAQILLAGKGVFQTNYRYRKFNRTAADTFFKQQPGNYNIKIGILGVGMIGRMVLERLQAYDYEFYAHDPYVSDEIFEKYHVKRASLDEIFSECQIISNHLPNLPSTVNVLTYQYFSQMKENATFINTGRGAQVVEQDLIRALQEFPERTAILDVFCDEHAQAHNPLEDLDNVFLTPHIAGSNGNERARLGLYMQKEAQNYIQGQPCLYEVTEKMLETMA